MLRTTLLSLTDGDLIDKLRRDSEEGGQKIFFIREDLGLFHDREVIDQNRIRMCAAHINTQDHDRRLSPWNATRLYNEKIVLTRQKKRVCSAATSVDTCEPASV